MKLISLLFSSRRRVTRMYSLAIVALPVVLMTLLPLFSRAAIGKDASDALVKITTSFQAKPIGVANGFAINMRDSSGQTAVEILSVYSVFRGADRADVLTRAGKKGLAFRITGGNDLYDVVRFTTDDIPLKALDVATAPLHVGDVAYVLLPKTKGKAVTKPITVAESSVYSGLNYYTADAPSDTALVGCPVLNAEGRVVGVVQGSASKEKDKTFVIGIEFNEALQMTTMSAADPSLQAILIPKQLPADKAMAASYLYLLTKNSEDTLSYLANLGDFIKRYPDSFIGYTERAAYYCASGRYAQAEADYNAALEKSAEHADIHYAMSNTLYRINRLRSYQVYKDWDLNRALSEAQKAYALQPSPIFLIQEGKCLYAMKRYMEAYDTYAKVNATTFQSAENLYYQARSLQMADGDSTVVLALLDSAVNRFRRPFRQDAAPYLYYRAQQYDRYGYYREASLGYKDYEDVVGQSALNDLFYYNKEQAELKAKLYPQALADIEKAIALKPGEYVYYVEKALIETRAGQYEEAVLSARKAQQLDSNDPDSYKLLGIALAELGRKKEAQDNLRKALQLGDKEAQEWLNNMK